MEQLEITTPRPRPQKIYLKVKKVVLFSSHAQCKLVHIENQLDNYTAQGLNLA